MPNKLTLSAETLRVLADEELAGVVGAKNTGKPVKQPCKKGSRGKGAGCGKKK